MFKAVPNIKLRHCRSQARMRKEERLHGHHHDMTHSQQHWTQHTQDLRERFAGGQGLAEMDAWVQARSRRVLQPTNGSSRKGSASSRAVAGRMAAKGALLTGFSLVMGLPGACVTTFALRPSSAWGCGVEQKHQGTLNRFFDANWMNME